MDTSKQAARFTAGPWSARARGYQGEPSGIIRDSRNEQVADCRDGDNAPRGPEVRTANAYLIAASPALYAALVEILEHPSGGSLEQRKRARAAIALANGQGV